MNFSDALMCLKRGDCVARNGWNGKGMFLTLREGETATVSDETARNLNAASNVVEFGPYILMFTAQKNYVPWLASQTDILAADWVQVDGI